MAKWLWRVNPKPEPVPEPEPVAAPKRAPVVDVTDSVWRAANQIAQRVWSGVRSLVRIRCGGTRLVPAGMWILR